MGTRRFGRPFWFRVLAVGMGLSPFLLLEAVLRLGGWHPPPVFDDPLISFSAIQPLFELDASGERYEISASRLGYFQPDSFAAAKAPDEFRVFCLGGSTVQGNPWGPPTAFSTWLELSLRAAEPGRRWDVVNCGGISYASYRLRPILVEILGYRPDLIVFYFGHNEFLENREYESLGFRPRWLVQMHEAARCSRVYEYVLGWTRARSGGSRVVGETVEGSQAEGKTVLPGEVDARLDYEDGLADYKRDDVGRANVIAHFVHNLRDMIGLCRAAGVPVLLCNPVCNLKDCPPFKSQFIASLSANQRRELESLWQRARESDNLDRGQRVELLEMARQIDGRHAGVLYELGQACLAARQTDAARQWLIQAKEEDICPLRILEPMHEAILQAAAKLQVPLVDVRDLFEELSPDRLPGEEMLVDHVHPTIRGHQKIAAGILSRMVDEGLLVPRAGWELDERRAYQAHLETLDTAYYARGKEHLEGLRRWSAGRAPKRRLKTAG